MAGCTTSYITLRRCSATFGHNSLANLLSQGDSQFWTPTREAWRSSVVMRLVGLLATFPLVKASTYFCWRDCPVSRPCTVGIRFKFDLMVRGEAAGVVSERLRRRPSRSSERSGTNSVMKDWKLKQVVVSRGEREEAGWRGITIAASAKGERGSWPARAPASEPPCASEPSRSSARAAWLLLPRRLAARAPRTTPRAKVRRSCPSITRTIMAGRGAARSLE
mmetsp:Transcript_22143/g.66560  ORF Transcript_22143/g.66560 Transcript_22143/m.66560 type:complete len:221 (-) Transcript_22143:3-665(-)